jgi:hypothetical protein
MTAQTQHVQPRAGASFFLLLRNLQAEKAGLVTAMAMLLDCGWPSSNRRGEQDLMRDAAEVVLLSSAEELRAVATGEEIAVALRRAEEIVLEGQRV